MQGRMKEILGIIPADQLSPELKSAEESIAS
jgi:hypothetical protein